MTYPICPDKWFSDQIAKGNGIFDRKSFELMLKPVKNFRIALDIGAHVGSWSIGMSEHFEKVLAFEANSTNYEYFKENTKDIKNIESCHIAIGDKDDQIVTIGNGKNNSGQSHIETNPKFSQETIKMFSIDTLMSTYEYNMEPHAINIDLIKIDVEGYELPVLRGATETIKRWKPVILLELNGLGKRYGIDDSQVIEYITSLGYTEFGVENKDHVYIPNNS
jgi:FkbM family methyltransferase